MWQTDGQTTEKWSLSVTLLRRRHKKEIWHYGVNVDETTTHNHRINTAIKQPSTMSKTHTAWQAVDGPSNKAKLWKNSSSTTISNILNNIVPDKISFNVCCADIMMAKAFVLPDKVCSRVVSETCETLTLYSMYLQLKSLQSFNYISIVISIPSVSFGCSLILILEMLS